MLTDGITDVMSAEDRPLRLVAVVSENVAEFSQPRQRLVSNVMKSVDLYRGGAPYRDDLTLLAFSINGGRRRHRS